MPAFRHFFQNREADSQNVSPAPSKTRIAPNSEINREDPSELKTETQYWLAATESKNESQDSPY